MKSFAIGMLILAAEPLMAASAYEIASPDGLTVVSISDEGGIPSYSVKLDKEVFVRRSPLGLITNIGDYTRNMELTAAKPAERVSDSYSLRNIKKNHVDYQANRGVYTFSKGGEEAMDVIFEVSDNNVAFRYLLYPRGETRCCVVESEATGFVMPEGTTTFLCPQSAPMGGFARTSPSYETSYTPDDATGKNGWGQGYTFPCLFRNGDSGWVLVSETGIAGDYCASHLAGKEGGLYQIAYPQEGEMNGFGSASAAVMLPALTPWRTVTVGKTLAPIVETTIPFDVVKPLYEPSRNYEYGKGSWSWIIKMDPSCNFDEQKLYIDFSAAMGYRSVLVDALWDTQIGRENIEKLAAYGKSKGVGLYLWYNSNGHWNDAPQGPRGIMNDIVKRRKEMAWMRDNGILGIKADFFGGDKQQSMQLYHDILADANDFGLLVIFHGCTLPRGWERMYPNYAASEAVLASENLHFSQGSCDAEAFNACVHPFVRNTVGSMDFGGSALNKFYNGDNASGSRRMTSDVFALATAVLFQSPVQHFALAPNNLDDAPAWAMEFMKEVPTTWSEIRFIDGYPGKYVVIGRRHGATWYIAGVNAADEPRNLTIELPEEIRKFPLEIYSDDSKLNGSRKTCRPDKKGRVKVSVPKNGGFVIVNRPDPDFQVYLCLGQSNMEGNARYEPQDTIAVDERFVMMAAVDMPRFGRLKGEWYNAVPPLAREHTGLTPADYFGRTMVEKLPEKKRVGVINVAVGGCKIELFNPDSCSAYIAGQPEWMKEMVKSYDNNPYRRLVEMAREAQRTGVIKGILLHQGESNNGDLTWTAKVKNLYDRLLADLGLDSAEVPLVAGEMLSADEGGICAGMIDTVNSLPSVIKNCAVVSSEGCKGAPDGLHFTAAGYRELGRRYAYEMLKLNVK